MCQWVPAGMCGDILYWWVTERHWSPVTHKWYFWVTRPPNATTVSESPLHPKGVLKAGCVLKAECAGLRKEPRHDHRTCPGAQIQVVWELRSAQPSLLSLTAWPWAAGRYSSSCMIQQTCMKKKMSMLSQQHETRTIQNDIRSYRSMPEFK